MTNTKIVSVGHVYYGCRKKLAKLIEKGVINSMGLSLWGEEILTEKAASFPICLVYRWYFPHRSRTKYFATLKFDYRTI